MRQLTKTIVKPTNLDKKGISAVKIILGGLLNHSKKINVEFANYYFLYIFIYLKLNFFYFSLFFIFFSSLLFSLS